MKRKTREIHFTKTCFSSFAGNVCSYWIRVNHPFFPVDYYSLDLAKRSTLPELPKLLFKPSSIGAKVANKFLLLAEVDEIPAAANSGKGSQAKDVVSYKVQVGTTQDR